jgi:hypothetical protein
MREEPFYQIARLKTKLLAAKSKNRELYLSLAILSTLTGALKTPKSGNCRSLLNIFGAHGVKPIDVEHPLS